MEREQLKKLLKLVESGKLDVAGALERIQTDSFEALGYATLDLHRAIRRGFPEAVYGPGKTTEQIVEIVGSLCKAGQTVLVTRVGEEVFRAVKAEQPRAEYNAAARALFIKTRGRKAARPGILVMTAGTADLPVAEEAALTAELMGNRVERVCDVGVAGIHRLIAHRAAIKKARVIVAVAGMDGVLPTVIAGLTDCPVVGVPTSTGYGTGAGGRAAMLAMLNSCASGLTVVNIDNGFGAGYAAALINRKI